jgi:predicted dehydrogenase
VLPGALGGVCPVRGVAPLRGSEQACTVLVVRVDEFRQERGDGGERGPVFVGGGELLDQGVHVLDLALQILPDLEVTSALCCTHFWDMPVDDNSWALLKTPTGQSFSMHVSSTEWKNEFQFDAYTRQCRYTWRGLGRSYGPETLTIYSMKPEMGPPQEEVLTYDSQDQSWLKENTHVCEALNSGAVFWGHIDDAKNCLRLVEDIYKKSYEHQNYPSNHPQWWSHLHKL